ncbi:alpha-ribazole phosphatase [Rhodothalassium salexigens DSM 2132]|uniref:Alpha-ribazole phosphatase n=1 Tax=Rhodothalassium salexigens DSM 2132 TaxID=1188247 RepID=A0A4R2PJ10_RHOSA|nr:histidine phosphatase family protein [Rhodothalassium salexigens]MBK1637719.1 hypothetical protein [Rhodothalassium salexigens DSM 2132]TCP35307.1 alpha-ribazole phosphatase [Rhodothalassium salexigens DSM 2132]
MVPAGLGVLSAPDPGPQDARRQALFHSPHTSPRPITDSQEFAPVTPPPATHITLIRHAPVAQPGRLYGRTEVDAALDDADRIAAVAGDALALATGAVTSPRRRCRQTLDALLTAAGSDLVPRVVEAWAEQDFGAWDGAETAGLPDLWGLPMAALAHQTPPGGESFQDLCRRIGPALDALAAREAGARLVVCTHAGVVRAAVHHVLGLAPGRALSLSVAPLSVTRLIHFGAAGWAVDRLNG